MPELPEVEFARGCVSRWLRGRELTRVEADKNRVIRGTKPSEFANLSAHRVTKVVRRGKWLLFHFDGELGLLAHLGMTGKFELARAGAPPVRWSRVRFTRDDGAVVHYRDPRQFGHLRVAPLAELVSVDPLASLGPDALRPPLSPGILSERFGQGRRKIKDVLMDQTVIAGLGNIQVTDALFLAHIHPARAASTLSLTEMPRDEPWRQDRLCRRDEAHREPILHLRKGGIALPALRHRSREDGHRSSHHGVLRSVPATHQALIGRGVARSELSERPPCARARARRARWRHARWRRSRRRVFLLPHPNPVTRRSR